MSKGLEALKRIECDMEYVTRLDFVEPIVRGEVQQELYKIYHREERDLDIIEKELKAFEDIKFILKDLIEFNEIDLPHINKVIYEIKIVDKTIYATKEKYDLLKEVLK